MQRLEHLSRAGTRCGTHRYTEMERLQEEQQVQQAAKAG